jgi:hypothetical protein
MQQEKQQYGIAKADVGGLIVEGVKREMCLQTDTFYVMNCKWKFHLVSAWLSIEVQLKILLINVLHLADIAFPLMTRRGRRVWESGAPKINCGD